MQKWLNRTNRHLFSLSYQSQKSSWFTDQQSELYLCENQDFRCSESHFYYSLFILSFNSLMHSWFSLSFVLCDSDHRSGKLVWTSLTDSMKGTESWKESFVNRTPLHSLVVLYLSAFLLLSFFLSFGLILYWFPNLFTAFSYYSSIHTFLFSFPCFLPLLLSYIITIFHNFFLSFSFFLHLLLFFHSYFSFAFPSLVFFLSFFLSLFSFFLCFLFLLISYFLPFYILLLFHSFFSFPFFLLLCSFLSFSFFLTQIIL